MIKYKIATKLASMAAMMRLILPIAVRAESTTTIRDIKTLPRERLEALREKAMEKRDDLREKVASSSEARKEKLDSRVKARFSEFMKKVVERFKAMIERFDKLVLRIESRIAKLDSMGKDTIEAKKLLVEAKAKIEVAKTSVSEIEVKANLALEGDTRALYPEVKEQFEKAKRDLKEAHAALVRVIRSLGSIKIELHASSTVEVS